MVKELPQFQQQVQIQPRALPDVQASKMELTNSLAQFGLGIAKKLRESSKEDDDAQKAAAQIQVRDGITHIREKVLDPQTFSDSATENYDAQVAGLAKGVLNTVAPKNKAAIANFVSYYGDKNRDVVVTKVNSLKKNQLVGGLQEYVDKTKDDAINAKLSDQVIPDPEDKTKTISKGDVFMGQINQQVNTAMNRGLITPKESFAYKQAAEQSYEEADYLHQFQQALVQNHNPDKWLDSFNKNKSVSTATKQKITIQAHGAVNKVKQSLQTSQNLIKQQSEDTIRQVSNGAVDISSPHVTNVRLRADALPVEDQQNFEHRLTAASVLSVTKKEMKFIPFSQSRAILKKLAPLPEDPGFKFKDKTNSALQNEVDKFQEAFKKDSFGYVSDNPDVIRAFETRMTAANDGPTKIQPAQLRSIDPFAVALDKERMMGANDQQLSVMKNSTAANISASLDSLPDAKSKMQFINDVFDTYGKYSGIAGRDLKKAGIAQNILDIANLDKIPSAKALLPTILQSIDQSHAIQDRLKQRDQSGERFNDFKTAAATGKELKALFNTLPNTNDSEQQKVDMINLVATAAAGDFLAGNSSSVDKAVTKMANAIYGSRYSGFVKEARIPINVSMSNAKDAMFATEKEIPKMNFLPLSRDPSGVKLTKGEIMQEDTNAIHAGHWRTMGDDSGVYWVDSSGLFTPMVLEKGEAHRLEIKWKDLQDPTSELNGLIAKHKRKRVGLF